MDDTTQTPMLSDKYYNIVKQLVQLVLPAVGSLYFGLAQIWDLPNAEKVVGTLALVSTFLGVLLRLSTRSYNASMAGYGGEKVIFSRAQW
jgi:hypothetical protein